MPTGGTPSHHDGEAMQPNLPYVDGMVWDTNSQLPPGNDVIEGMFLPDVSGTAREMSVGLRTNNRGGSVESDLQPIPDNSTSRPGSAWSRRFGIGRADAWLRPGSYTATSFRSTRLAVRPAGTWIGGKRRRSRPPGDFGGRRSRYGFLSGALRRANFEHCVIQWRRWR